MKTINVFIGLILSVFSQFSYGQGCVAIRGNMASSGTLGSSVNLSKGEFMTQLGSRYFKSYKHFRGATEETHRVEEGTNVINHSEFLDLSLNYGITDRWYAALTVPFVFHNRSSMYEHGGNPPNGLGERHLTSSRGLADLQLGVGYWLFDPQKSNFNYALALGVKFPTGKYDYMDTFYNQGPNKDQDIEGVVDQSIQPGDGGTGLAVTLSGYQPLSPLFTLTTDLFYLFNFTETNGVLTRSGSSEFSSPDQYSARLGVFYTGVKGWNAYLGGRMEGVPSNDLIGGSAGYRRPGYVISVEPGIGYSAHKYAVFLSIPIAVERNRTQSYLDKQKTEETGVYSHGDAAFADYLINLSFAYRFGGGHDSME